MGMVFVIAAVLLVFFLSAMVMDCAVNRRTEKETNKTVFEQKQVLFCKGPTHVMVWINQGHGV